MRANCHGVLHHALDRAAKWRELPFNPADDIELPKRTPREMCALSADEVRAVLRTARTDELAALWVLMLTTGLRRGELLALRSSDIDLEAGRLAVVATSVRLTKRSRQLLGLSASEPIRGEPKTARGRRVVELPALAVDALRQHRREAKVVELNGSVFNRPDG